jgi:DNA/RNA-binding domain of Phe-tRNA-synthetase-like protein
MTIEISQSAELTGLSIGAVEFTRVRVTPSAQPLRAWSDEVAIRVATEADLSANAELRQHVRQMLRYGKFKASGRSKPAQEYLLRCAVQDRSLPNINAPVDILNTVSLECNLPISLLSIRKSSEKLHVRRGQHGEAYVFNAAGQELEVEDLIVVCDQSQTPSRPIGSPIKDSMVGKIEVSDDHLIAIVYGPSTACDRISLAKSMLIDRFNEYEVGQGTDVQLFL